MKVKKINPEWIPSENKGLKIGDIIEITDPKSLIINGDVVAVSDDGTELSAYDLYGVITRDERSEFEAWKKIKNQEALKKTLEAEKVELEKQLEASKTTKIEAKKK